MTVNRRALPFEDFPRPFKLALQRLETPRRGRKRYSPHSIASTRNAAGQYLAMLQRQDLEMALSREGLGLFIDDLDARQLKNSTRLTYLSGIQALAKELRYPAEERRLILEDCGLYREAMLRDVPRKVRQLAAHPITLRDIAKAAITWRATARDTTKGNRRRSYYQRSGVLALLSMLPLRIGDVTRMTIGEHVHRTGEGWSLQLTSGKTGYRHHGQIHPNLTPFLDDLLLYGASGPVTGRYLARQGTPLFATEIGEFLSPRTLAYSFKTAVGHSPHIVRTLVHDALAQHGTYGSDVARVLCGQTSLQIARRYEVHANRHRVQKAQEILAALQAGKPKTRKGGT